MSNHTDDFVVVRFELRDHEALALAQFVKRVGWIELRRCAVNETEAEFMSQACSYLREGLAEAGYAPR
jgi:hypothetical protein